MTSCECPATSPALLGETGKGILERELGALASGGHGGEEGLGAGSTPLGAEQRDPFPRSSFIPPCLFFQVQI